MRLYEHHKEPLLPSAAFWRRVLGHGTLAGAIILFSLSIGAAGYRLTENMPWIDAMMNASMILTGMGPATQLHTSSGKLFATVYALYSGIIFLVVSGILVAPFAHRILHRFHLGEEEKP